MKPTVLATPRLPADAVARLSQGFNVISLTPTGRLADVAGAVASDIRAIATPGQKPGCPVDQSLFAQLPNLEIIASFSSGLDGIDALGALARGITVTHAPDVMAEPVADIALALTIDRLRGVTRGVAYVQAGRWGREGQMPLARSCQNKLAGIVGLGRIGKAVARRLAACGMRILYHGRNQQPAMPYTYYNDLHAMARDSDILVLCCPATEATIGLVDANVLRELGPQGILINVSRGSVVDETALIAALGSQTIAGAGLDVCVNEPNPNPALVAFDNVTLLPHLGAATIETRVATFDTMIANIQCHFSGLPLPNRYAPA